MKDIRPQDTARSLVRRFAEQFKQEDELATRLLTRVRASVPEIAAEMGLRRVFLFGSLVWGGVHSRTDVDLAVEGLPPAERASFHVRISREVDAEVDVVLLESAPDTLRRRILQDGELVYPRSGETP